MSGARLAWLYVTVGVRGQVSRARAALDRAWRIDERCEICRVPLVIDGEQVRPYLADDEGVHVCRSCWGRDETTGWAVLDDGPFGDVVDHGIQVFIGCLLGAAVLVLLVAGVRAL